MAVPLVKAKAAAGLLALVAVLKLLSGGMELYSQGQYQKALEQFEQILTQHPKTVYTDDAVYWSGRCCLKLGKPKQARQYFERLLADHPESEYAPAAQAGLGFLLDRWGKANLARVGPWDYLDQNRARAAVASYFFAARSRDMPALGQLLVPAAREALAAALKAARTPELKQKVVAHYCGSLETATNFRMGPAVVHLDNPSQATVELVYTDSDGKSSIRQVGAVRSGRKWYLQSPF